MLKDLVSATFPWIILLVLLQKCYFSHAFSHVPPDFSQICRKMRKNARENFRPHSQFIIFATDYENGDSWLGNKG